PKGDVAGDGSNPPPAMRLGPGVAAARSRVHPGRPGYLELRGVRRGAPLESAVRDAGRNPRSAPRANEPWSHAGATGPAAAAATRPPHARPGRRYVPWLESRTSLPPRAAKCTPFPEAPPRTKPSRNWSAATSALWS